MDELRRQFLQGLKDLGVDEPNTPVVRDGQHKHGQDTLTCFFCVRRKPGCQYFSVNQSENTEPELRMLYNQKFVVCPECFAKGMEFLAKHLLHWVTTQKLMLNKLRASPRKPKNKKGKRKR